LSLSSVISLTVFFPCTAHTTPPPSFPTRRSSDLGAPAQVLRFELGSDRLGLSRVHAAVAEHLPGGAGAAGGDGRIGRAVRSRFGDRKSTRLNSSLGSISYAVFCLKKKNNANRILY